MVKLSTINAVPMMTSNTTPIGTVRASSIYSSSYDAWRAFDKVDNNTFGWMTLTNNTTGWIEYEFVNPIIIGAYTLKSIANSSQNRNPKDWTFEGSNDGDTWIVLDSRTNEIGWVDGQVREYKTSNVQKYKRYRLNITANNGFASATSVGELGMYEVLYDEGLIIENTFQKKYYSLDDKTLLHLPNSKKEITITHGIKRGKEIKLDEYFDNMKYVVDTSEVLGDGKIFTHDVDMSNTKINKIIL